MLRLLRFPFSLQLGRKYWQNCPATDHKQLDIIHTDIDLSLHNPTSEQITLLLCQTVDPNKLMAIYRRYKESFNQRHILLILKTTAKLKVPSFSQDPEFGGAYMEMIRQFNQYIEQLNNLDLSDFLYWFKKIRIDNNGYGFISNVDQPKLVRVLREFLAENKFLSRQLHLIYECQDLVMGASDLLTEEHLERMLFSNELSASQLMQFLLTLSRRFYKFKVYEKPILSKFLDHTQAVFGEYDLDQTALLYKNLKYLKIDCIFSEQKYLRFVRQVVEAVDSNLEFIESGALVNLLLAAKYAKQPEEVKMFNKLSQLMTQCLSNASKDMDLEFLLAYLNRAQDLQIYNPNFPTELAIDVIIKRLRDQFDFEHFSTFIQIVIQFRISDQRIEELVLEFFENSFNPNLEIQQMLHPIEYLHYRAKKNVVPYLESIMSASQQNLKDVQKSILLRYCLIYDDLGLQLPEAVKTEFNSIQLHIHLTTMALHNHLNQHQKIMFDRFIGIAVTNFKVNSKMFNHWNLFIPIIKSEANANDLAEWFCKLSNQTQKQILPYMFFQNEGADVNLIIKLVQYDSHQAAFFVKILREKLAYMSCNVVTLGMIYCDRLLYHISQQDFNLLIAIIRKAKYLKNGAGTALLIRAVEMELPELISKMDIKELLLDSYQTQKQLYDHDLILLMVKYNCLPVDQSLQIYYKLFNPSCELRLFLLYLCLIEKVGLESLLPHLQKQIAVLNEHYTINIEG